MLIRTRMNVTEMILKCFGKEEVNTMKCHEGVL